MSKHSRVLAVVEGMFLGAAVVLVPLPARASLIDCCGASEEPAGQEGADSDGGAGSIVQHVASRIRSGLFVAPDFGRVFWPTETADSEDEGSVMAMDNGQLFLASTSGVLTDEQPEVEIGPSFPFMLTAAGNMTPGQGVGGAGYGAGGGGQSDGAGGGHGIGGFGSLGGFGGFGSLSGGGRARSLAQPALVVLPSDGSPSSFAPTVPGEDIDVVEDDPVGGGPGSDDQPGDQDATQPPDEGEDIDVVEDDSTGGGPGSDDQPGDQDATEPPDLDEIIDVVEDTVTEDVVDSGDDGAEQEPVGEAPEETPDSLPDIITPDVLAMVREPPTMMLLALGLVGAVLVRFRPHP